VLGLSEGGAYNRIEAARAARRYPVVLELLRTGALHLTAVRVLAPHLTEDNHRSVLASARGKTREEVLAIAAALSPQPAVACSLRRLGRRSTEVTEASGERPAAVAASQVPLIALAASAGAVVASPTVAETIAEPAVPTVAVLGMPGAAATTAPASGTTAPTADHPGPATPRVTASLTPRAPAAITPLAPEFYRLIVTMTAATRREWQQARELIDGDDAHVLERILQAALPVLLQRRVGAARRPGPRRATGAHSRHIPAEVRRAVHARDGGSCAFVGSAGERCGDRRFLQFHHLRPWMAGGASTPENIALRCREHNQHESDVFFGGSRSRLETEILRRA
jgi:hypothetical protein